MTDIKKLDEAIKNSGCRVDYLAKQCELTAQGFLNKRKGLREFSCKEAYLLKKALNLSNDEAMSIFFADEVDL